EEITVAYKDEAGRGLPPMDAVTNADRDIEELLVKRIRSAFPDHGILGEEGTQHFPPGHDYTWVLDPIDGTQNFVNGLPFYASSVGVLHHGRPVAGAIWGATTHRLRPGVYHARSGGSLRFEGVDVATARPSKGKLRSLSAMPHDEDEHVRPEQMEPVADYRLPWDRRHVGSGALE